MHSKLQQPAAAALHTGNQAQLPLLVLVVLRCRGLPAGRLHLQAAVVPAVGLPPGGGAPQQMLTRMKTKQTCTHQQQQQQQQL
jgi:hypothetical protein